MIAAGALMTSKKGFWWVDKHDTSDYDKRAEHVPRLIDEHYNGQVTVRKTM